jgi:hypothetical protein
VAKDLEQAMESDTIDLKTTLDDLAKLCDEARSSRNIAPVGETVPETIGTRP